MKIPAFIRNKFAMSAMAEGLPKTEDESTTGGSPYNVRLIVKYFRQEHGNMCKDACVVMMLNYKNVKPEDELEDMLQHNPRGPFSGASFNDIKKIYSFDVRGL